MCTLPRRISFVLTLVLIVLSPLWSEPIRHTVQPNETLYSISRKYSVSIEALTALNGITDPRYLKVGMVLVIPSTYVVERGDTLYGLAKRFGISVEDIEKANSLDRGKVLKVGTVLVLPGIDVSASTDAVAVGPNPVQEEGEEVITVQAVSATDRPRWPLNGEPVMITGKLTGAEMAGNKGDVIVSISSGTVVWNSPLRGYGRIVIIESADRHMYLYGGSEAILVEVGEQVIPGTEIARLGINPHDGESRLFFSVFKNGRFVDPAAAPRI